MRIKTPIVGAVHESPLHKLREFWQLKIIVHRGLDAGRS
ncbi:hypothetical protein THTE_0715 [Thermogutta terrifontis]|uniref:Uncharacterized protein n=1 Tax=Thermogutta terrifontis TaxID=1331910 RepID=A0A286RBL5_9BACT|nr:hypothetical protein THTE_0715 [Thermogutta terrifontis]